MKKQYEVEIELLVDVCIMVDRPYTSYDLTPDYKTIRASAQGLVYINAESEEKAIEIAGAYDYMDEEPDYEALYEVAVLSVGEYDFDEEDHENEVSQVTLFDPEKVEFDDEGGMIFRYAKKPVKIFKHNRKK